MKRLISMLVFLAGCASVSRLEAPEGTTEAQMQKDKYECSYAYLNKFGVRHDVDLECLVNQKGYKVVNE